MVLARLLAAFAGPAPPPVPEPLIDVLKYHLRSMPLAGAVVYLAVILALHRLMRWREQPLSIPRSVLVMYNLVQVAINAYVAYAIAHAVGGWVFGLGVRDTPAVRHGVYLHYLCKVRTRTPTHPTKPATSPPRQPASAVLLDCADNGIPQQAHGLEVPICVFKPTILPQPGSSAHRAVTAFYHLVMKGAVESIGLVSPLLQILRLFHNLEKVCVQLGHRIANLHIRLLRQGNM